MTQKQLQDKMFNNMLNNIAAKQGKTAVKFLQDIKEQALAKEKTNKE